MKSKVLLVLAGMALCAWMAWMARGMQGAPRPAAGAEPVQTDSGDATAEDSPSADQPAASDQDCLQLLQEANRGEALAWLTETRDSRGVARWDKNDMIALIKQFYAAGAVHVWVVDTDKVAQTEVASQFVVQLPAASPARAQVFACEARFRQQYDEDPTPDTGQKYLLLYTD